MHYKITTVAAMDPGPWQSTLRLKPWLLEKASSFKQQAASHKLPQSGGTGVTKKGK